MTFKPLRGESAPGANDGESEQQFRQWWSALFAQVSPGKAVTGVLYGLAVSATTPAASGAVVVGTGAGVCQPTTAGGLFPLVEPSDETFDVFTAHPMQFVNNPRHDIVALDQVTGQTVVLVGDSNAIPVDPDIPTTVLPLARLRHDANATTIPGTAIDDLRVPTRLAGASGAQFGRTTVATDATGNAVIPHALGVVPAVITGTMEGLSSTGQFCVVYRPGATASNIQFVCYNHDNSRVASASVTINWIAKP